MIHWGNLLRVLRETARHFSADRCLRLAAGISYYMLLSLAPLIILLVALAGVWWGRAEASTAIVDEMNRLMGEAGADVVQTILKNAGERGQGFSTGIVGLATLILGGTAVFHSLQDAMNVIWKVEFRKDYRIWGYLRARLLSAVMIVFVAMILMLSLIATTILGILHDFVPPDWALVLWFWRMGTIGLSTLVATVMFAAIFKYMPDVRLRWREVMLGAVLTAILFTVGKSVLGLYLGRRDIGLAYGAAGSIVVFLVWVYYSTVILLLGAEFTRAYIVAQHGTPKPENYVRWSERSRTAISPPASDSLPESAADDASAPATTPPPTDNPRKNQA